MSTSPGRKMKKEESALFTAREIAMLESQGGWNVPATNGGADVWVTQDALITERKNAKAKQDEIAAENKKSSRKKKAIGCLVTVGLLLIAARGCAYIASHGPSKPVRATEEEAKELAKGRSYFSPPAVSTPRPTPMPAAPVPSSTPAAGFHWEIQGDRIQKVPNP